MQTRKQTKNIKLTHEKKSIKMNQLRTWIFDKPVIFALLTFGITFVILIAHTFIMNIFASQLAEDITQILLIASVCWTTYYLIKKLPHDKMYRDDFIAITNGCSLMLILFLILTITLSFYAKDRIMWLFFLHPTLVGILALATYFISMYFLGVIISDVYAKYKRAVELGISKWKIILSMPFGFLLMWTPGYLIPEKKQGSNLTIQSKWFAKFNKWVMSNPSNTLLVFLIIILSKILFTNTATFLLTVFLLVIYTLWFLKHRTSFIKNINRGYALTAIAINITTILIMSYVITAYYLAMQIAGK